MPAASRTGRPRPTVSADKPAEENSTVTTATVSEHPAVSSKREENKARRAAERAERKARLEAMSADERKAFRAQERTERAQKRAATLQKRPIKVQRVWLEGMADAIGKIASATAEGKPVTLGGEAVKLEAALARISAAIRAQVGTVAAPKAPKSVAKDKVFVVVRTNPMGERLALPKQFRGAKGEEKAAAEVQRATERLEAALIKGYSHEVMRLSDVEAQGIEFPEEEAAA